MEILEDLMWMNYLRDQGFFIDKAGPFLLFELLLVFNVFSPDLDLRAGGLIKLSFFQLIKEQILIFGLQV